ncbi:MAG: sterol desaturase family protein [Sphingomonadaceae bacterium]
MLDAPAINFAFVAVVLLNVAGAGYLYWRTRNPNEIGEEGVRNAITSLLFFFVNALIYPVFLLVNEQLRSWYDALGIPALPPEIWADLPTPALVLIGIVAVDFADYWNHRLMHRKWLFPIHAIHHSDTHVNGLTTYRVHMLEPIVMATSYVVLLTWLGMPQVEVAAVILFAALHNAYVHINLGWTHGPFEWLLASPQYHRWHHADLPEAYGKNLANIIPLWDRLFGTYYNPGPCHEPMGARLTGVPDTNALQLIIYPFAEWRRMIAGTQQSQPDAGTQPRTSPDAVL